MTIESPIVNPSATGVGRRFETDLPAGAEARTPLKFVEPMGSFVVY
jgi:hypothetical protein